MDLLIAIFRLTTAVILLQRERGGRWNSGEEGEIEQGRRGRGREGGEEGREGGGKGNKRGGKREEGGEEGKEGEGRRRKGEGHIGRGEVRKRERREYRNIIMKQKCNTINKVLYPSHSLKPVHSARH